MVQCFNLMDLSEICYVKKKRKEERKEEGIN